MNIEAFRNYCLAKKGVTEHMPFGDDVLVFKVMDKMFALCDINKFESINLKCNPETAIELREQFQAVKPGYHMNKTHWNTIEIQSDMSDMDILKWINHSYNLVVNSLPKKQKQALLNF